MADVLIYNLPKFSSLNGNEIIPADNLTETGHLTPDMIRDHIINKWGEPKGGYLFDGVNDYVRVPNNANLNFGTNDFSIEAVIIFGSDVTTNQRLINKRAGGLGDGYSFIIGSGILDFAILNSTAEKKVSCPVSANSINTIVGVKEGSNLKIYKNGALIATTNITGFTHNITNAYDLQLGMGNAVYYKSKANLFRFMNRALSDSEVLSLYNNGLTGQNALPIADVGANNTELYTLANAISTNEANATTGLSGGGTISSVGTDGGISPQNGSYMAKVVLSAEVDNMTSGSGSLAFLAGKKYKVRFYIYPTATVSQFKLVRQGGVTDIIIKAQTLIQNQWNLIDVIYISTATGNGNILFQINNGGVWTGTYYVDFLTITQIGCVAEYLPENAGDYSWYDSSGNRLHGEVVSTAGAGGASPLFRQLIQKATTGNFTTNIASGVASKVIYCPPGYSINSIAVRNTLASGNITDFQAVMAGVNLVTGKTINNAKSVIFKTIADHEISTSPQAITFTATGNGTGGIEISVAYFRRD